MGTFEVSYLLHLFVVEVYRREKERKMEKEKELRDSGRESGRSGRDQGRDQGRSRSPHRHRGREEKEERPRSKRPRSPGSALNSDFISFLGIKLDDDKLSKHMNLSFRHGLRNDHQNVMCTYKATEIKILVLHILFFHNFVGGRKK